MVFYRIVSRRFSRDGLAYMLIVEPAGVVETEAIHMFGEQTGTSLVPLTMSSAVVELGQHNPDWQLAQLAEEGTTEPRVFKTHVTFDAPFANVPMVHAGIT
jgi:hypothetical protein